MTGANVITARTAFFCLFAVVHLRSRIQRLNKQFLQGSTGDIGEQIGVAAVAKFAADLSQLPRRSGGCHVFQEDIPLSCHHYPTPSAEKELLSHPVVRWGIVLMGFVTGCLVIDLFLRRPLLNELASVRRELALVEKSLDALAGTKESIEEANDLLSAMQAQKRHLETARAALEEIRDFRQSVEAESQKTAELSARWKQITDLHAQIVEAGPETDAATVDIEKLGNLRTKVLEHTAGVEQAQKIAAELASLKDKIRQMDDLESVQSTAKQLLALRDALLPRDDSTEQAQAHATELLTLRDEVAANVEDTQIAKNRWASVRQLEADMRQAGGDIAQAIETLELLTDLGTELRNQTQAIAAVRQSLLEVAMLETTVGRALRVLEPLAQLRNLSRLSDTEVRAAARAILDQRNARLSQRDAIAPLPAKSLSPEPKLDFAEEPLFPSENRLAPLPSDLDASHQPAPPTRTQQLD